MLGVLLDWLVPQNIKQQLQTKLESLLYKFRYTTLRTFGREEIEFSLRILNLLGRRFLSWQRLAALLTVYAVVAACLWIQLHDSQARIYPGDGWLQLLVHISISVLFFSLSISCTFWLCRLMLTVPFGTTFVGTCVLLLVHLLLLVVWRPIIAEVMVTAAELVRGRVYFPLVDWEHVWDDLSDLLSGGHSLADHISTIYLGHVHILASASASTSASQIFVVGAADDAVALLANGLRLTLAFIFILGFGYTRLLRRALIWFWSALVRSNALFSPPLSAAAAMIILIERRDAIFSALARPFQ
jgi:hypothetical protein